MINPFIDLSYGTAIDEDCGDVNRTVVPFISCGDLSMYDSDQTYSKPEVNLDAVQAPLTTPYRNALIRSGRSV